MRTLYIHAGAHKTASSMLQSALRLDNEYLLEKGLRVIFRSQIINRDLQKCLYKVSRNIIDNEVLSHLRADLKEVLPKRDLNCLITNEDMFSGINIFDFYDNIDVSLKEIRGAAEELGWNVKFILYIRSQADYIESVYLQHIHLGRSLSFNEFIGGELPEFLSWKKIVDKAVSVLGEGGVTVEPFESIKEKGSERFYFDFLEMVGVNDLSGISFDGDIARRRGANRSYSRLAVKIARKVNPLLNKEEKRVFREFLQEKFSTATHERSKFLSEAERESLIDFYSEGNRILFSEFLRGYDPVQMGYCNAEIKL